MLVFLSEPIRAQSKDPKLERAINAEKKTIEARLLRKRTINRVPLYTDAEKDQRNKETLERIRKHIQQLDHTRQKTQPFAKYKPGPGGAAERINPKSTQ